MNRLINSLFGIDRGTTGQWDWLPAWRNLPDVWIVMLIIIPAVLLFSFIVYRKESYSVSLPVKLFLTGLRSLAILIVLIILFQPIIIWEKTVERESTLILLIDESLSMGIKDKFPDPKQHQKLTELTGLSQADKKETGALSIISRIDEMNRLDLVNKVLTNTRLALLENLQKKYKIKLYTFSNQIRGKTIERIGGIIPTGESTAVGTALTDVLNAESNSFIAGIILISDGQNNVGPNPVDLASSLINRGNLVPVYTIAAGNPQDPRDIELLELRAPEVARAKDFVSFDFSIRSKGFENETITVTLNESASGGDKVVAEERIALPGNNKKQSLSLRYKPQIPGEYICTVTVPLQTGELIEENNTLTHHLKVVEEKIRVLFVENYPRWEYRYLKNALIRDHSIKASCLLLEADPDFPQESSPGVPPLTRWPRDKKELFEYDVIIFGDINPHRLAEESGHPSEFMNDLVSFVEEIGGGIAFIAGPKYNPRTFRNTPLADLLPVILEDEDVSIIQGDETLTEAFKIKLTAEGRMDPMMRLEPDQAVNQELWEDNDQKNDGMPGLLWFYPAKKSKSGAKVLAVHPFAKNKYGPYPLLAAQPYPRGRIFFSALDETWRWRFIRGDKYFYTFWSEIIKYLSGGRLLGNKRYNIKVDPTKYSLGAKINITARIYNEEFEPLKATGYTVHLELPDKLKKDWELKAVPKKTGEFSGLYTPKEIGNYNVWAGPEEIGREKERGYASFVVHWPKQEYENPTVNRLALEQIAEKTKGVFLPIYQIDQLPAKIKPLGEVAFSESREDDLWDTPFIFLLFLGLIATEWIIRKLVLLL